jgi:putative FmdB family regulatory protein
MPIYAYRCADCGFAKDVLQKISDEPLTECPSCHAAAFKKQVTAAGFQLKGSGWYQTDFRDSGKSAGSGKTSGKTDSAASDSAGGGASDGGSDAAPVKAAAACAPGCGCH